MAERVEWDSTLEEFKEEVRGRVEAYRQMLQRNRERARTEGYGIPTARAEPTVPDSFTLDDITSVGNMEEVGPFIVTARENIVEFGRYRMEDNWQEHLLSREDPILVRSTTLSPTEMHDYIKVTTDIDGCVVEFNNLAGLGIPISHISIHPKKDATLVQISPLLKKHIKLTSLSPSGLKNFAHCVGYKIFYEQGWQCCYSLVPAEGIAQENVSTEMVRMMSELHFIKVANSFRGKIIQAALQNHLPKSVPKNEILNFSKFRVLPDEQSKILTLMQDAMREVDAPAYLRKCCFMVRFGDKSEKGVNMKIFEGAGVKKTTIHVAINIMSPLHIDLLWSATGIAQVVGNRGCTLPCLSFRECVNFQSNVDGREMDISGLLRSVFSTKDKMTFLQMYADVPHATPSTRSHPVSGGIACVPLMHHQVNRALKNDGSKYLSTMASTFMSFHKIACRMEAVLELATLPQWASPADYVDKSQLTTLLHTHPMLVPFQGINADTTLGSIIKGLGRFFIQGLTACNEKYFGTGDKESMWTALCMELAMEKMLRGYPIERRVHHLARELGPGTSTWTECSTDVLGFLRLNDIEDIQLQIPLHIWTSKETIKKRINRYVGFHDCLHQSKATIGEKLIKVILTDIYDCGNIFIPFPAYLQMMEGKGPSGPPIVGRIRLEELAAIFSQPRRIPFPMIMQTIFDMLEAKGHNLEELITIGLRSRNIVFFPAIQTTDERRRPLIQYKASFKYWRVVRGEKEDYSPAVLSDLVKSQLEVKGLMFGSRLRKIPMPFPWIQTCITKMDLQQKSYEQIVRYLTLVSAIALISNGFYVDFDRFKALLAEEPGMQLYLRDVEILGKIPLLQHQKFYRLHPSIPRTIQMPPVEQKKVQEERPKETTTQTNIMEEDTTNEDTITEPIESFDRQDMQGHHSRILPSNAPARYFPAELEILNNLESTYKTFTVAAYMQYRNRCLDQNILVRQFQAVRMKFKRLQQARKRTRPT